MKPKFTNHKVKLQPHERLCAKQVLSKEGFDQYSRYGLDRYWVDEYLSTGDPYQATRNCYPALKGVYLYKKCAELRKTFGLNRDTIIEAVIDLYR